MSAESTISAVFDTNILVYAHVDGAEFSAEASSLLDTVRADQRKAAVTPQVLLEFYSVITNAKRVTAPYSPTEASLAIKRLLAMPGLYLLPYPPDLIDRTQALLERHPVTGAAVYDLQIVATMLGNGIHTIYTYDRKGFEPFVEIEVAVPSSR